MAVRISDEHFSSAEGTTDWRALFWGAKALFETGDFATGAQFVARIADVVAELGHAPLVDLRTDSVVVQVITVGVGLSDVDLELAGRISAVARAMQLTARPESVQQLQVAVDTSDAQGVVEFWRAALGYVQIGPSDIVEPNLSGPAFWFQDKQHVPPRNRLHIDVSVPHDQAQARIDAVVAAGGRILGDRYSPAWVSLIDPDGNVVDIATWQGRDEYP